MKHSINILLILFSLILTGCGHNILTNYKVKGIDISIPIGGYPFGIKIGVVEVNSNMVRGNATYSAHNNTGVEVGSGATQTSTVIQFSSNAQINEGNVEKIMTDENVSDSVKKKFVAEYLSKQQAPEVLQVTTKTPVSATVSGNDSKIHENIKLESQNSILDLFSITSWIKDIIAKIILFFTMNAAGKLIILLAKYLAGLIIILFVYDIIKKIWSFLIRKKL